MSAWIIGIGTTSKGGKVHLIERYDTPDGTRYRAVCRREYDVTRPRHPVESGEISCTNCMGHVAVLQEWVAEWIELRKEAKRERLEGAPSLEPESLVVLASRAAVLADDLLRRFREIEVENAQLRQTLAQTEEAMLVATRKAAVRAVEAALA